MKKMVSRLLALALMGSLVLSGCGSADVGTSNNATDTNSEKAESETGTETETGEESSANEIKDLVFQDCQPESCRPLTFFTARWLLTLKIFVTW